MGISFIKTNSSGRLWSRTQRGFVGRWVLFSEGNLEEKKKSHMLSFLAPFLPPPPRLRQTLTNGAHIWWNETLTLDPHGSLGHPWVRPQLRRSWDTCLPFCPLGKLHAPPPPPPPVGFAVDVAATEETVTDWGTSLLPQQLAKTWFPVARSNPSK